MIATNSVHKSYRWSGSITIILFPLLIAIFSKVTDLWVIILQIGLAFVMGSFFRVLVINYRQSETIRNQKHVLEQYVSQVERITLLEERDRLSKRLTRYNGAFLYLNYYGYGNITYGIKD